MSGDSLGGRLRKAVTPAATVLPELPSDLRDIVRQSIEAVVAIAREIEAAARCQRSGHGFESVADDSGDHGVPNAAAVRFLEGAGDMAPIMVCRTSATDERTQVPDAVRIPRSLLEPTGQ